MLTEKVSFFTLLNEFSAKFVNTASFHRDFRFAKSWADDFRYALSSVSAAFFIIFTLRCFKQKLYHFNISFGLCFFKF